jgi:hypothetical protein
MMFLGPTRECKGEKINKNRNTVQNKTQDFKNTFFQRPKIHYKPTCEVGSV